MVMAGKQWQSDGRQSCECHVTCPVSLKQALRCNGGSCLIVSVQIRFTCPSGHHLVLCFRQKNVLGRPWCWAGLHNLWCAKLNPPQEPCIVKCQMPVKTSIHPGNTSRGTQKPGELVKIGWFTIHAAELVWLGGVAWTSTRGTKHYISKHIRKGLLAHHLLLYRTSEIELSQILNAELTHMGFPTPISYYPLIPTRRGFFKSSSINNMNYSHNSKQCISQSFPLLCIV